MKIKQLMALVDLPTIPQKIEELDLTEELTEYHHSWAGSFGKTAVLVGKNDSDPTKHGIASLDSGYEYSENGRTTQNFPAVQLGVALKKVSPVAGDILVINEWDNFDNASPEHDDWYYYVLKEEDIRKISDVNLPEGENITKSQRGGKR